MDKPLPNGTLVVINQQVMDGDGQVRNLRGYIARIEESVPYLGRWLYFMVCPRSPDVARLGRWEFMTLFDDGFFQVPSIYRVLGDEELIEVGDCFWNGSKFVASSFGDSYIGYLSRRIWRGVFREVGK